MPERKVLGDLRAAQKAIMDQVSFLMAATSEIDSPHLMEAATMGMNMTALIGKVVVAEKSDRPKPSPAEQ
jgi:hypothetical protein